MAIDIDRDKEFFPAIKKIMTKLKDLEDKISLMKSDLELIIKTKKVK